LQNGIKLILELHEIGKLMANQRLNHEEYKGEQEEGLKQVNRKDLKYE